MLCVLWVLVGGGGGGGGCYFSEVTWEFFQWSMEKYW